MINSGHFFGVQQVREYAQEKPLTSPKFQTPGLYRYMRHPIMVGFLIAFWATPRMTLGHLLFAATTTTYILIALRFEERDLLSRFGQRYHRYRQRVPMLLPRLNTPGETGRVIGETLPD
jgi:protein-S-isoprenylcysteine O-methyltransferase Ste14